MARPRKNPARGTGPALRVVAAPGTPRADLAAARSAILAYLRRYLAHDRHDQTPFAAARYEFRFLEKDDYSYEHDTYRFDVVPIGGRTVKRMGGDGTIPDWFHMEQVYKMPPRAIEQIPPDPSLAYRGMSWEEWQAIRHDCLVGSKGWYNLGQERLTLFGEDPDTAVHYATGFAPWVFHPGLRRPGVVIAVPKSDTLGSRDRKDIPDGERALLGKVDVGVIERVWYIHPTRIRWGEKMEVWVPTRGRSGSVDIYHSSPAIWGYAIVPVPGRDLDAVVSWCRDRMGSRP